MRIFGVLSTSLLAAALLSPTPAQAAVPSPVVINFTGDTPGGKPNGYASPASPDVLFSDTVGADLDVYDAGVESHGLGLGTFSDDASALEIRLAHPSNSIKLGFGNDDASVADVTDQAQLTVFRGATQVGQVLVNVNANDVMDQTIGFSGRLFNRAQFQYVDAAQVPLNLIEVVDDIKVGALCTVVGTSGANHLTGTAGKDVICGDAGSDVISGLGDDDLIFSGPGADTVSGGGGGDKILGGKGRDNLSGNSGHDSLNGGAKRDTCNGGTQTDQAISCEIKSNIP
jgi:Ca2+-binding RTX toxin-like protein